MTTDAERHRRAKTRLTPEQHGERPVWCDYTSHLRESVAEAVYEVALRIEECGEDLTPEAVQSECLFYAIKPTALPWDRHDVARNILEKLADHLYDDSPRAEEAEWTYTDAQRDALAHALSPAMDYLATLDLGHEPDDDTAIDVGLEFVREVLEQEPHP